MGSDDVYFYGPVKWLEVFECRLKGTAQNEDDRYVQHQQRLSRM